MAVKFSSKKCRCLGPQYGVIRINMKVDTIMENKNAEGFCEEVLRQQKRRAEPAGGPKVYKHQN